MRVSRARGRSWWLRSFAILAALGLFAAACGDDDDDEPAAPTPTEAPGDNGPDGDDPYAGCDDDAVTDPSDLSADRQVARCEPGYPAPQPLEERTTIRMTSAFRAEYVAPLLLADHFGEFDAENIDFEWIDLGFSDAASQAGTCDVDFVNGSPEAAAHNAIDRGFEIRWVLGNFYPPDAGDESVPQTGLWARADTFSDPDNPDLSELAGQRVASAVGLGSIIVYPLAQALAEFDTSLLDLEIETIPSPEMTLALENEAVQAAYLLDPYWVDIQDDPNYILAVSQPPGEPLGGLFASPCILDPDDKFDAGVAFVRAVIRTINTYLDGDYKQDEEVLAALVETTGIPEESFLRTPPVLFDWEIRDGTSTRAQEFYIEFGTVEYDEPIPEDQVVDRSLQRAALGQD